ncbi:MAG TPA: hypothetical protein VGM18_04960 [Candidatus Sulfotelmatobacter sp.]|jgi:hypothetical protein
MSAKPVSISDLGGQNEKDKLLKAKRRSELRDDVLYVAGALLVTAGVGLLRISWAFIAAGFFCMLLPLLQLATGFIRGLRSIPSGSRR